MKLGMYIMAPVPIFTGYFINTSHQCVYIVVRQRIHVTIEELLDTLSMLSVSYQKESRRLVNPRTSVSFDLFGKIWGVQMLGFPPASAHGLRPTSSRSESAYPRAGLGTGIRPLLFDVSD
jgi:hypothetical protein